MHFATSDASFRALFLTAIPSGELEFAPDLKGMVNLVSKSTLLQSLPQKIAKSILLTIRAFLPFLSGTCKCVNGMNDFPF